MLESLSIPRYCFPGTFNSILELDPIADLALGSLAKEVMRMEHQSGWRKTDSLWNVLIATLFMGISFALIGSS